MSVGKPWILGVSVGLHNGAACLMHGDEVVVAIQEERLTRIKRDILRLNRPSLSIDYCLNAAGISIDQLDAFVSCSIKGRSSRSSKNPISTFLDGRLSPRTQLFEITHHLGHALSAFMTSGFSECVTLVVDGAGSFGWEFDEQERKAARSYSPDLCEHVSLYHFDGGAARILEKHMADTSYLGTSGAVGMPRFNSLGHMFSSVSQQIFGNYFEAGKVMGLAPYGSPRIPESVFLTYEVGGTFSFKDDVLPQFTGSDRWPQSEIDYCNLAASVQQALETTLADVCKTIAGYGLSDHLAYSGGVALNSVANHRVMRPHTISDLHVFASAEDNGTAVGAAYYGLLMLCPNSKSRKINHDFLGRKYGEDLIADAISATPGVERVPAANVPTETAKLIADGHIVGWFQGGSEFGPRALGHRSILCDPRRIDAKEMLNSKIKFREAFRPFAPAILEEELPKWFEVEESRETLEYMLEVCKFRHPSPGAPIPGVTHVDGTGRVQVVSRRANHVFYDVIDAFFVLTGVPILINTSLNIMGEPIVETPREALWLLLSTGLEYCVIGNNIVRKGPNFQSSLSLIPTRTCSVEVVDDKFSSASVATLHGAYRYNRISADLMCLLNVIDGKSSGYSLMSRTKHSYDTPEKMQIALSQLFRYSTISFLNDSRSEEAGTSDFSEFKAQDHQRSM